MAWGQNVSLRPICGFPQGSCWIGKHTVARFFSFYCKFNNIRIKDVKTIILLGDRAGSKVPSLNKGVWNGLKVSWMQQVKNSTALTTCLWPWTKILCKCFGHFSRAEENPFYTIDPFLSNIRHKSVHRCVHENFLFTEIIHQSSNCHKTKLNVSEWASTMASIRQACAIFMLSNEHLDMPHWWGGLDNWVQLVKNGRTPKV